jgi:alpha-1,2-mannosyltransferase
VSNARSVHRSAGSWAYPVGMGLIFLVAFGARLVPVLRGGGLYAIGNYDDGVYYAAAMGLAHGLMPYRDFLLLHPPGVVLALAPFAGLAQVLGEPDAMAVARLCWMALGGVNAVLCGLVLRPLGRLAALVTGLMYAVIFGAIYVEQTVSLEPPATTVTLAALVITRALGDSVGTSTRHYVSAGLLLGLSPLMKIWGVITVLVVVVWLAYRRGVRNGMTVLLSAMGSCAVLCLPFFVSAPASMWQMVVVDQVGRRRGEYEAGNRIDGILGLSLWTGEPRLHLLATGAAAALLVAALAVCIIRPQLRLLAALLISHGVVLAVSPMWFRHYAGFTAAPLVLVLGGALATLLQWAGKVRSRLPGAALAAGTAVAVLISALPLTQLRLGRSFPGRSVAGVLAGVDGCVVTDVPMTLIQADRLRRNLDLGCRYEVDLGGASYHLDAGPDMELPRAQNDVWQVYVLEYLRTGQASVIARFHAGFGFSHETARIIANWPEIGRVGRYVIRRPQP